MKFATNSLEGRSIDFFWTSDLLNLSAFHHGNPVGDGKGFFLVVGNVYGGYAKFFLHFFNGGPHLHTQLCIQIG